MNYQMRKVACCYRLKKLANVAGLIQRSRLTKLADGLVDPVEQRKFKAALEQDFNDMDRRDGITTERPLDLDYSQPPLSPVTPAYDNTMANRNEIAHLGQSMDKVTSRDPSAVGAPVATNDMLSGDLASGPDGYTRSPAEEEIVYEPQTLRDYLDDGRNLFTSDQLGNFIMHGNQRPEDWFAEGNAARTQQEYRDQMALAARGAYGKSWSELNQNEKNSLRSAYFNATRNAYWDNNSNEYFVPRALASRLGRESTNPQKIDRTPALGYPDNPNERLLANNGMSNAGMSSFLDQAPQGPAPNMVASTSALGTTANIGGSTSGVGATPSQSPQRVGPTQSTQSPPQQAFNRTRQPQQRYVFNGPIAQGIRRRNGGPVFNGPIANRFRQRFGR